MKKQALSATDDIKSFLNTNESVNWVCLQLFAKKKHNNALQTLLKASNEPTYLIKHHHVIRQTFPFWLVLNPSLSTSQLYSHHVQRSQGFHRQIAVVVLDGSFVDLAPIPVCHHFWDIPSAWASEGPTKHLRVVTKIIKNHQNPLDFLASLQGVEKLKIPKNPR